MFFKDAGCKFWTFKVKGIKKCLEKKINIRVKLIDPLL